MSQPVPTPPFSLGAVLGSGALATVVRVADAAGRIYAGKILHASQDMDSAAAARFARESDLVLSLEHPNLVRFFGSVEIDGRHVHLMELVDGPTLAELVAAEAPLAQERILALARGIAAGLDHAHTAGVIHRDLKPANVLVAAGDIPKITDFGMARASSYAGIDRDTFAVVGTPDYMAPESLEPLAVDARADLYALGCILFEMATGHPPYGAATPFGVLEQHRRAPVPELPADDPYDAQLRDLVARLLAKAPGDRPQAASAVVADIDRLATRGASSAQTAALAPIAADLGRCARCGQLLVPQVALCMDCGFPQAVIEPGDSTLFVTGPGKIGHKLDSKLRKRLLDWIRANPGLRLDAAPLEKSIPRLPFVLTGQLSERSAARLCQSLQQLGFATEHARGGPSALPAMRKKSKTMGGRVAAIAAGTMGAFGGVWSNIDNWGGIVLVFLYAMIPLGGFLKGYFGARKPAVARLPGDGDAMPPALGESLGRLTTVVPTMQARRHRQALRSVVQRVLALASSTPVAHRPSVDGELAHAVDVAMVAAAKIDRIDERLASADLREVTPEVREQLHERDTWAARLLDLTAALDGLDMRLRSATRGREAQERAAVLDDLRARVEALEEVQADT